MFPAWQAAKIDVKTGIRERRIAEAAECSSDLAVEAALKLFASEACQAGEIDFILLCTQKSRLFFADHGVPCSASPRDSHDHGCAGFRSGPLGVCLWPGADRKWP